MKRRASKIRLVLSTT